MAKFLDENGLLYLWSKIKSAFVSKETGKGLSTNDYTTTEKNKLSGIDTGANNYALPTASSSVMGGVKVGSGLEITAEGILNSTYGGTADNVAWTGVTGKPTTINGYGITDTYTKTEVDNKLTSAVTYKGSVNNYSDLALTGNKIGDMYNIVNADTTNGVKAGDNAVWNGAAWDIQSGTVDLTGCVQTSDTITNAEIDTIVAS